MKQENLVRQSVALSLLLLLALFLLPLRMTQSTLPQDQPSSSEETQPEQTQHGAPQNEIDEKTPLKVLVGDEIVQMDLGTYLLGVVRAEMPATFEIEALKAQAVAARTYTLYKILTGGNHGQQADICTDSTCCQAYISLEAAQANWGDEAQAYEEKIEDAVKGTDGQTILYGGIPVLAVFHSCSAGMTRGAGEVWQNDLPYLQPVSSPEPADAIPNYYSRVEFTAEEFREKVLSACPEADLSGGMDTWLDNAATDSAGSVETVEVGGVSVKGSTLRSILGLRSACIEWEVQEGKLVFFVTGYGHGVGLSQYGANQMAKEGADYREILTHYYTGVTVEPYQLPQGT